MTAHPYAPFIQWIAFSYFRGSWHDLDIPKTTMAWIRSFGVTAAPIDRFLKLGHSRGNTLPNSLVLDIIELANSPLSKALNDDCLKGMLNTWAAMADVYGQGTTPSELEMNRLDLLADWGHALVGLPGSGFPGGTVMVTRYVDERRRLDLSQLRKDKTDFKYVGLMLELVRLQEQLVWPLTSVARPAQQQAGRPAAGARKEPASGAARNQCTRNSVYEHDRLPCLPTSGRRWIEPSANLAYELYGNWREDWRNTLP